MFKRKLDDELAEKQQVKSDWSGVSFVWGCRARISTNELICRTVEYVGGNKALAAKIRGRLDDIESYVVAVLEPLRTARFAEEELRRTKTDAIDAFGIVRFTQQKRPRGAALARRGDRRVARAETVVRKTCGGLRQPPEAVAPGGGPGLSRVHPSRTDASVASPTGFEPVLPT
jgi:hypothetical protein